MNPSNPANPDPNNAQPYRLLYDGACPICRREILALHRRRPRNIDAIDTSADNFDPAAFGLKPEQIDAALYGIQPDGGITVGMESLREAYRQAGIGWLISWTALWPARPAFNALYRHFARNRIRLSRLLTRPPT